MYEVATLSPANDVKSRMRASRVQLDLVAVLLDGAVVWSRVVIKRREAFQSEAAFGGQAQVPTLPDVVARPIVIGQPRQLRIDHDAPFPHRQIGPGEETDQSRDDADQHAKNDREGTRPGLYGDLPEEFTKERLMDAAKILPMGGRGVHASGRQAASLPLSV